MREEKKKKENIIYVAIGILTLIVATASATYAYYTATASNNSTISGDMATITFDIDVVKKTTVDNTPGLIPMTNSMVQKAVSNASGNGICVDDNSNAVCQIYKITVTNSSTASMFVDGYVTLKGGSGVPVDFTYGAGYTPTTMRWAQVFCGETSGNLSTCTTKGKTTTHATSTASTKGIDSDWDALGSNGSSQTDTGEIQTLFASVTSSKGTIQGNTYSVINKNYIRVSKHGTGGYTQANDVSSAIVYNQYLAANDNSSTNNTGDSNSTYVDVQVFYFVVWLSETGTNQTVGSGGTSVPSTTANFFEGAVVFNSAQGSEVTATFTGYTPVTPDTK